MIQRGDQPVIRRGLFFRCHGQLACPCWQTMRHWWASRQWHPPLQRFAPRKSTPRGWVMLETVIATGMLVMGLAVIGAQVHDADRTIREMELNLRGLALAQMKLAELDLGLVELDSVDAIQEEEFGSRYPAFAWRLTIEDTAISDMFLLKLEVLHHRRPSDELDDYTEGGFDFDNAQDIATIYALRSTPKPINLAEDFGLSEEQVIEIGEQLQQIGIPGLDVDSLNPSLLATLDFEEFLEVLPVLAQAFGIDLTTVLNVLPPGLLDAIQESGVLDDDSEEDGSGDGSS